MTNFTSLDPTVQVKLIEIAASQGQYGTGGNQNEYSIRFAQALKNMVDAIDGARGGSEVPQELSAR